MQFFRDLGKSHVRIKQLFVVDARIEPVVRVVSIGQIAKAPPSPIGLRRAAGAVGKILGLILVRPFTPFNP